MLGDITTTPARVFRLKANGVPDRSFGRRGVVAVRPPVKPSALSSLTVDGRGRPLLVGVAVPRGQTLDQAGQRILVGRLSASGVLDRGFGGNGWLRTTVRGEVVAAPREVGDDQRGWWKVGPQSILDSRGRLVVATSASSGLGGILLARYRLGR
jgi:hypothetical protein